MVMFTEIPIGNQHFFRAGLKAILSKSKWQYDQFDDLYDEFWDELKKAVDSKEGKQISDDSHSKARKSARPSLEVLKNWLYHQNADEILSVPAFSELEVLTKKSFQDMSEEEMRLMMTLLRQLARRMARKKSRLKRRSKRRRYVDLRRTFARNMRRGGNIDKLEFSEAKEKRLNLVLLCDVSKSMDLYSRFVIHLIYAFQNSYDRIETFVFSTSTYRVTEWLENHEFEQAFDVISERFPQWSGGTAIGQCLKSFIDGHGYTMLSKKTKVLILSDGWDVGEPALLSKSMSRIHKNCNKVIWLNPLGGIPDFSPEAIGLKTAIPFIDIMASAHNLESLKLVLHQLQSDRKRSQIRSSNSSINIVG